MRYLKDLRPYTFYEKQVYICYFYPLFSAYKLKVDAPKGRKTGLGMMFLPASI